MPKSCYSAQKLWYSSMTWSSFGQYEQKMFGQEGFLGTHEMPKSCYSAQKLWYTSMTLRSPWRTEQKILDKKIFWALQKFPKVAILPKNNNLILSLQALFGNANRKYFWALRTLNAWKLLDILPKSSDIFLWLRVFFWALQKCPKGAILPKSNDVVL